MIDIIAVREVAKSIMIISMIFVVVMIIVCIIDDHWIRVKDLAYQAHKKLYMNHKNPNIIIRLIMAVLRIIQKY